MIVSRVLCSDQSLTDGDGRTGADIWVATSRYRLVLRHPLSSMSAPFLGGGTIIDAASWGGPDAVHEIVPVVAGGGLADTTVSLYPDYVEVTGTVAPLPDRPPPRALGERRTLRYLPDPYEPFLQVQGAEGFFINPMGDEILLGSLMFVGGRVLGADGQLTDLGGAFQISGDDRLLVSSDDEAFSALAGQGGVRITGVSGLSQRVALFRGGELVGSVPITSDPFDVVIPAGIDLVRGEATGRAPSALVAPGDGIDLSPGPKGDIDWKPVWEGGRPRWFQIAATSSDGRAFRYVFGPGGGLTSLGAGIFDITISAGPLFSPIEMRVELLPNEILSLPVALQQRLDPGDRVLAGFARPADRSRDWRGSDMTAGLLAAADGLSYATFAAVDDVATVDTSEPAFPILIVRNGVTLRGDGYSVSGWPFSSSKAKSQHGAPLPTGAPLSDAASLYGGLDDARTLLVDLGFLSQVGSPFAVSPAPALVSLAAPGPGLSSWAPWFAWNDAGRTLTPTGPYTWVSVPDPLQIGAEDIEQELTRGDAVASTGPWLSLTVDGLTPGEVLPASSDTGLSSDLREVSISVRGADHIDHIALVTDGGALQELPLQPEQTLQRSFDGRWVALAVWSDDGLEWAVTSPIWTKLP